MVSWLGKSLEELKKKIREGQKCSISPDSKELRVLSKLEDFIKAGVLRVLYCLDVVPSGLRYSELEELTGIPRSTLIKVLNHLESFNMITTVEKETEVPRKEKVPFYILTEKGEHFIDEFIFLSIGLLEEVFGSE